MLNIRNKCLVVVRDEYEFKNHGKLVYFCPFCDKFHRHGGMGAGDIEHRLPHCYEVRRECSGGVYIIKGGMSKQKIKDYFDNIDK